MSDAIKCDRCAALAERGKGNVSFGDYRVYTNAEGTSRGYQADLCPKCSREFLKWIGHKP